MALQVWLPFNGDLHNQGLDPTQPTPPSGITYTDSGKIGKALTINAKSFSTTFSSLANKKEFTISFWHRVDLTASYGGYANSFSVGFWVKSIAADGGLTRNGSIYMQRPAGSTTANSTSSMYWTRLKDSAGTVQYMGCGSFTDTSWHHFALVCDGTKLKRYLDGAFTDETVLGTYIQDWHLTGSLTMGTGNAYTYFNDFRIYDHGLSAKEVKEISKGLILNYKLDDISIQQMNNCYNNPTFNTSTSSGGWSHWTGTGGSGSYGQTTDKNFIYNKANTYAHYSTCNSSAIYNYLLYQSPAFDGGIRSLQAIIKESQGRPITEDICSPTWNARNGGVPNNKWTSIIELGDGFYLCKCEGISQDGSDDLVGIYTKPGYTIYVSEAYLENDREICSNIESVYGTGGIAYDCSGYGHDGVINGTPVLKAGSGRYNNATTFNTSSYITNSTVTTPEIRTMSAWVYVTSTPSTSRVIAVHPQSHMAIGFYSTNGFITSCYGTNAPVYLRGTFIANAWNHICTTGIGANTKCYVNGVLCSKNGTTVNNWTLTNSNTLYIAGRVNSTLGNMLDGSLSDFRLYVTELSADDVLELYNTGACVDKSGNIETCQVNECITTAPQVTKTAELQVGSLVEYDENVKTLSDGSTWVRVLHHNNPASKLFTRDNCWYNTSDPDLFSALVTLRDTAWRDASGKYEFLVCEKLTTSSTEQQFRWSQTNNPVTETPIAGYTLISGNPGRTVGLRKDGSTHAVCHNGASWWCACGSWTAFSGGIPGFGGTITTGYMDLYVRVPSVVLRGATEGQAAMYASSSLANQFLEI